jgi:hypothetical protein
MSHEQRTWLLGAVRHAYPDNPWIARLDEATRGRVKGENWIR